MLERTALRKASDQVPAWAIRHVQRKGELGASDEQPTSSAVAAARTGKALSAVERTLRSSGQPLDAGVRGFMEQRFGHDFAQVRVHADADAAASATSIRARAYAVGTHIAFARGEYSPGSAKGRHLLAHELAHVIQQSSRSAPAHGDGANGLLQRTPECARAASCPPEFCSEYPSRAAAEAHRSANRARLISAVGRPVTDGGVGEVSALYGDFIDGGHGHRNLSDRLARFFTKSSTTAQTMRFLNRSLEEYFRANPPPRDASTTVDVQSAIPGAIAAIGRPGDANAMAFRNYTETPGLLAGGVGVGQAACPVGAIPSTIEDSRTASGTATALNSGGSVQISSSIEFTVMDTLDFCPGNCGGSDAQELTVPLSRYEATGISGDEPFTVTFPQPIGAYDSDG